jgi:hypothetical protein
MPMPFGEEALDSDVAVPVADETILAHRPGAGLNLELVVVGEKSARPVGEERRWRVQVRRIRFLQKARIDPDCVYPVFLLTHWTRSSSTPTPETLTLHSWERTWS